LWRGYVASRFQKRNFHPPRQKTAELVIEKTNAKHKNKNRTFGNGIGIVLVLKIILETCLMSEVHGALLKVITVGGN